VLPFSFYVIIGLIQGILEWLPVSSEGQILLIGVWYGGISETTILQLAFFLHLGTLFVVLTKYYDEWVEVISPKSNENKYLRRFIIITTIGTGLVGIPIRILLFNSIENSNIGRISMWILGLALIVTGIILKIQNIAPGVKSISDLTDKEMLLVGLLQGFTIIPGISRSGTTVSTLLALNCKTSESFRGSFLISVPAVLGAVFLDILFVLFRGDLFLEGLKASYLIISVVMAFIAGLITINLLLKAANRFDFSYITLSLGVILLSFLAVT